MAEPDTNKASPDAAQETGWTGVEKYIGESDASEMKVLNDDIDALLIFAGLFSAVLTAFVVPSYLLLQPDNSQLSVQILDRISAQLARFEIVPPFINSTASDSSTSAFQVSTSARWMNCLWFLSLILSLSSALFGILAKQWIREYLQWRKVAAAPRENVLLRQLRIEAWEDWKVSAGISTIPALLELAVVLFLVGLVVLGWTLDTVVAIVITTAVSVVIMVLCTVTVLPAVYRRCPYKSPTGWACVIMFDALAMVVSWTRWHFRWLTKLASGYRRFSPFLWNTQWLKIFKTYVHTLAKKIQQWIIQPAGHLATTCSSRIRRVLSDGSASPPSFPRFSNWRERDLYIDDLGSSEISDFTDVEYPLSDPKYTRPVAKDICEVMPLVRALSWVRKGTEDPRLLKHVATSAESLHTDNLYAGDCYYVFMYVLRKLCSAKSKSRELQPLSALEGQLQSKAYKTMFDQNEGYSDPFARHQFVMMADLVMRSLDDGWVRDRDLMGTLLEKMSEAVTISLKEGYENCGCNHTLPWISSMPLWLLLDVLEKTLPAVASNEEDLDEVDGTDEESNPDEVMAGRKTFIKLKKRAERFYPRLSSPSIALAAEPGPITSVAEDVELSESIPSDNPASVIDAKNEAVGMGDGETQHGGKEDILVPESHSQAARPSEGISVHTVGHPAEETQKVCASSLHHNHQDLTSIQHMELDVPIDRQDAVPSPEQDPDITAKGDNNHVAPFFTEPWTGQSNSVEVAASDDSRRTALMLPINPSASDGLPSTRPLPHDSTAHTDPPLAFPDGVPDPGDHENLPDPILQSSEPTADLGIIITRSSSTSRDEDVQPVEQSLNSTEPLEEGPDSIEMGQRGCGASQAQY
ncbi:hypothetical protein EW026_g2454 [Hermanssonia centrifuga]|uniref:DUF6535 domain-containing protein n=1 Tax=Hermanssonia centrifuga TaxID=98765 RepID=A0A4S4KN79_9APHY|nr:hypothetical protein EW026_g2454 [Hermanssonia centrifuga]